MQRRASIFTAPLLALSFGALVVLGVGCSAGRGVLSNPATDSRATGSLVMHIAWPKTSSRLIPAATHSIQLNITYPGGGLAVATATIPQGQTTTTISNLPIANMELTASALDANGQVAAAGTTSFTTVASQQVTVSLNLASTIDHLVISPANPVVTIGAPTPLQATGVNTDGEMVLLASGKLTWRMASPADAVYAGVDSNGNVTGVFSGAATVAVSDSESGKSGTTLLDVGTAAQAQQQTICLSNERRLGLAILEYAQDYDGRMPCGFNGYGGGGGWAGQVYPYVRTTTAFACPSDTGNSVTGNPAGSGPWRASSYGINANLNLPSATNPTTCGAGGVAEFTSAFNVPARTVLLFEVTNSTGYDVDTEYNFAPGSPASECGGSPSGNGLGGLYAPAGSNAAPNPTGPNDGFMKYATGVPAGEVTPANEASYILPTGRHQGGANYAMADGHVVYLLPSTVSAGWNASAPTSDAVTDAGGAVTAQAAGTSGHLADGVTVPKVTYSVY